MMLRLNRNKLITIYLLIFLVSIPCCYAQRTIQFSDVEWTVRSGFGGPGPNNWSDGVENVWLDDQGRLHMRIYRIGNKWYCSEIFTTQFTTYGEHRFLIEGDIEHLDKNVVLGLFTYADETHEIDIEFSKWGDPNYQNVGSFTVQPYAVSGNQSTFAVPLDSMKTTHLFNWQEGFILFQSYQGHYDALLPNPELQLHQWIYWGDNNPQDTDHLRTHINFWLVQGNVPVEFSNLEIIISRVIQPLSTNMENDGSQQIAPRNYRTFQNYPNPFNTGTLLKYELYQNTHVDLSILNVRGEKIRTIVNMAQSIGNYEYVWDGVNDLGEMVASGMYFSLFRAGNTDAEVNKIVFMK